MDCNAPAMLRIISSAVSVATKAGEEVRRIARSGQLGVIDKGIQDFQTEADRCAQRMIVASLSRKFPKCKIVGEENLAEDEEADKDLIVDTEDEDVLKMKLPEKYCDIKEDDITIWVDPLDATAEFVKGIFEHVTVLIGISLNGDSVAGIINQPFYGHNGDPGTASGRTMWGIVGLGGFGVEPKRVPGDKFIITTTASHGNSCIDDAIDAIKHDEVLRVGGAGNKVLYVIEGKASAYVFTSSGSKRWDTSAPEALLSSFGGRLTDVYGNPIDYKQREDSDYVNSLGVVATADNEIHEKVIRSIPSEVKEKLSRANDQKIRSKF